MRVSSDSSRSARGGSEARSQSGSLDHGIAISRSFRPMRTGSRSRKMASTQFFATLCSNTPRGSGLTLEEIRRVAKAGAVIAIGTPGFTDQTPARIHPMIRLFRLLGRLCMELARWSAVLPIHDYPGDYYRFSVQAFREVFLAGLDRVEIQTLLTPPRIIGVGVVPPVRPRDTGMRPFILVCPPLVRTALDKSIHLVPGRSPLI